jgi:hypothetical protein
MRYEIILWRILFIVTRASWARSRVFLTSLLSQEFKIIPRGGVIGIELQRLLPVRVCAGVIPFVIGGESPVIVRRRIVGVEAYCLGVVGDCPVKVLLVSIRNTAFCIGFRGVEFPP